MNTSDEQPLDKQPEEVPTDSASPHGGQEAEAQAAAAESSPGQPGGEQPSAKEPAGDQPDTGSTGPAKPVSAEQSAATDPPDGSEPQTPATQPAAASADESADGDSVDAADGDDHWDDSEWDAELEGDYEEEEFEGDVDPLEEIVEDPADESDKEWYILKVQVNRENSICDALERRVKMHGLESQFGDILVPTEDVKEFTKTGKQRIVKRKLYPGYIVVHMALNDDTWFIVRETPGIGDFTGSAGKPAPLETSEVDRILKLSRPAEADEKDGSHVVKNSFPFKVGDQVRVNEGNFQSLEGGVENIDESNGRITVMLNMFGRQTPVQLDHWQVEKI